jgi:hypothetical protein
MKLSTRINLSPDPARFAVSLGSLNNQVLFPHICTTSEKWFRERRELFRRRSCDETLGQKAQ